MATTLEPLVNTDILTLKGKKVLAFPEYLQNMPVDYTGLNNQFMMIKINNPTKSTPLSNDSGTGVVVNPGTGTGNGTGTITNPIPNMVFVDPDTRQQFGDEAVKKVNWTQKSGLSRLDKVIVLPMPNNHRVMTAISYKDDYDPGTLSKIGDMINSGNMLGSAAGAAIKYALGDGKSGITGLINGISKNINATPDQLLASERLIVNKKEEVMFTGFGFRTFNFQYQLAPKNEKESDTIHAIIETLRYYSLPELYLGREFYVFPAEFEIIFMLGNKINPNIPRITPVVLKNINVEYSPDGIWATLPNGAPVAVNVNMEFLELERVDRSRVWKKDSPITSGY